MFCTGCVKALYFCLKISVTLLSYHSNDIMCDSLLIYKDLIHSAQFSVFYGLSRIPLLIQYRNARYQKLDGETYSFDIFYTLMHTLRVVMDSIITSQLASFWPRSDFKSVQTWCFHLLLLMWNLLCLSGCEPSCCSGYWLQTRSEQHVGETQVAVLARCRK